MKQKQTDRRSQPVQVPPPTIWALRKNVQAQDNHPSTTGNAALYEPIFSNDSIRITAPADPTKETASTEAVVSAENPQLNIINPETNFLVRELCSKIQD